MSSTDTNTSVGNPTAISSVIKGSISSFFKEALRRSAHVIKNDLMLMSVPTGINTGASLLFGDPSPMTAFISTAMTCGTFALLLSGEPTERNTALLQSRRAVYRAGTIGSILAGSIAGLGVLTDSIDPEWVPILVPLAVDMGYAWYVAENEEQSAAQATELGSLDAREWPQARD